MYKVIRIVLASLCFIAITLLFLDFTGTAASLWGWLAKVQLIPAILSLNLVALAVILLLTLIFGRIYCSVLCPLGVMQDCINRIRGMFGSKKSRKNRFAFKPALAPLRIVILAAFVIAVGCGFMSVAALIEPYSEYGRIASTFFAPVYDWGNNLIASQAEHHDSYLFYHVTPRVVMLPAVILAGITFLTVALFAWFDGRGYCNKICPVGTILGYLSKVSLLKPVIDKSKCNGCRKCERNCKASCIDARNHIIDYSRCVDCMDCIGNCSTGAIRYTVRRASSQVAPDESRRTFIATGLVFAGALASKAEDKLTDGGVAAIIPKQKPQRQNRIVPPGAVSVRNLERHCTSCQLCISECPNGVLRPSMSVATFMQPEVSYEYGYCRPECTRCSEVCPAGAIIRVSREEKAVTQVGHAVIDIGACLSATGAESCGKCSRACPAEAIVMVGTDKYNEDSPLMPVVNESLCIGCGACENLCPVSPLSAIHVEGHSVHRKI
ncbi:MAG: 4Fe-4S binding protein [Paramuribaculum sp.]|nr:4Fe-4S binding protein [Paramuribaculum sp.]